MYAVKVFDCAGLFASTVIFDWDDVVWVYRTLVKKYPTKVVLVFNQDRVDLDFDGLTEEERDEIYA